MLTPNQAAPGDLEEVRRFINTWVIPNQTRVETDLLPSLVGDPRAWERELSAYPLQADDSLGMLLALRQDLRIACADHGSEGIALNPWFAQTPLRARIETVDGEPVVALKPAQLSYAGHIVAIVVNAVAHSSWSRLKTCDDCRWAFYDHTRSANKRWCGMSKGGPEGRACGTIAKVRAFRERKAKKAE